MPRFIGYRRKPPPPIPNLMKLVLAGGAVVPPELLIEEVYEGDPGWEELEREVNARSER